jgi:hypothetical protein
MSASAIQLSLGLRDPDSTGAMQARGIFSAKAPDDLRPDAQLRLLATPEHCLAVIELAVNWEAEKHYGVEGLGPFDEF